MGLIVTITAGGPPDGESHFNVIEITFPRGMNYAAPAFNRKGIL